MKISLYESMVQMSRKKKSAPNTVVPGDETPFKATVVSSADGANILNNLETLVNKSENMTLAAKKKFIGDLAKAIEAETDGSDSQYATFETIKGDIVTIRLAFYTPDDLKQ